MRNTPYETARRALLPKAQASRRPEIAAPLNAAIAYIDTAETVSGHLLEESQSFADAMARLRARSLDLCDVTEDAGAPAIADAVLAEKAQRALIGAAEIQVQSAIHAVEMGIALRRLCALVVELLERRILKAVTARRRQEVIAATGEALLAITGLIPVAGVPASALGAVLQLLDAVSDERLAAAEDILDRADILTAGLAAWTSAAGALTEVLVASRESVDTRLEAMDGLLRTLESSGRASA